VIEETSWTVISPVRRCARHPATGRSAPWSVLFSQKEAVRSGGHQGNSAHKDEAGRPDTLQVEPGHPQEGEPQPAMDRPGKGAASQNHRAGVGQSHGKRDGKTVRINSPAARWPA
jgi:hypothetical protein